ncbi:metallo-beta-lactamase superfamily protein [Grosmannia clavigera kw1407]|uniref:Metallo-beta-lactamase superfamily protein n=1 Tax=Grosmannia clavigera (strain kw1407 / UAMH 11150) TaxID=655863 RepID=F0XR97_GROCL|nr:metallo-beta-lactamase superfamily protein [Grosmannia clavigera kw1407]EFW99862.1 metallo-beta-lactamase superfamily protein [Grosmannia clavigera kw1407]
MASQLASLPEVERLSPICIRILGGNPGRFTLQGTNTYLLGTGRERLLVDTGEGKASWAAALARTLAAEDATLAATLITHWHPDHVGGIEQVRRLVPHAPVYQDPDIADNQQFCVEGATLRAVHTPGHTTDHMVFVLAEEDAVLAGDNVLGHGTAVFEDLAVYLHSLALMRSLYTGCSPNSSARLYPGHGPVVADGPAKIAEYIQHRKLREDQVVRLLRTHDKQCAIAAATTTSSAPPSPASSPSPSETPASWTAMELVEVIYADTRKDLHPAAEKGLLQILDKLEQDGMTVRDGRLWSLRERSPL